MRRPEKQEISSDESGPIGSVVNIDRAAAARLQGGTDNDIGLLILAEILAASDRSTERGEQLRLGTDNRVEKRASLTIEDMNAAFAGGTDNDISDAITVDIAGIGQRRTEGCSGLVSATWRIVQGANQGSRLAAEEVNRSDIRYSLFASYVMARHAHGKVSDPVRIYVTQRGHRRPAEAIFLFVRIR